MSHFNSTSSKQSGSALLTALFITAIAAILATMILLRERHLIWQAELIKNYDQATAALQGVQSWAKASLISFKQKYPNQAIPRSMSMAANLFNTKVTGQLQSEQGLFNLNDLQQAKAQIRFAKILQLTVPNLSNNKALVMAKAITQNIQQNNKLSQSPFWDKTELRVMPGITAAIYNAVQPYITALPISSAPIDINNAPWPVIASLSQQRIMSVANAKAIATCIKTHPAFTQVATFQQQCAMGYTLDPITTQSQYFLLIATAHIETQSIVQLTLLQLASNNKVNILWQRIN